MPIISQENKMYFYFLNFLPTGMYVYDLSKYWYM